MFHGHIWATAAQADSFSSARHRFLKEQGAFSRDADSVLYRVDFGKMKPAVDALSARILTLQGDGDHAGARAFLDQYGKVGPELQSDLDRIAQTDIPVDIVFRQGREVLGL